MAKTTKHPKQAQQGVRIAPGREVAGSACRQPSGSNDLARRKPEAKTPLAPPKGVDEPPVEVRTPLTAEEQGLWDAYRSLGSEVNRNALATYYAAWTAERARWSAKKWNVIDADNFIGDVLLQMATKCIPGCRNPKTFRNYVAGAIRRMAAEHHRRGKRRPTLAALECDFACDGERGCELCHLLESVPVLESVVLWLRFSRGFTLPEIADAFHANLNYVKKLSSAAIRRVREARKEEE